MNIIKGSIKRSYSVAGYNESDNSLEFYIKYYPGGALSEYWFNSASKNDLLRIEGPKGTFFIRDTSSIDNIIFLATGTGIAPVKSILEILARNHSISKNVYLFWGARYADELFLDPKLIYSNLNYFPVLSRDNKTLVNRGYVQNILLEKNIDLRNSMVYACGSNNMIKELVACPFYGIS
ncbi:FAD-binding oxidoreductase [uncultured Christiangramia sp.]|uniref:FAD-binding oxidoreductase n=1 Tax=Christiangramia sp. 3-2217-3z TaxID=3417564 RepID=UPI0026277454|nr:FAD-binding oxidoreductase [uncultured Christiangramia sp.]